MFYLYENIVESPNLDKLHLDVAISTMTDKNIQWCRWDEDITTLKVVFDNILSHEDENLLAGIVQNNL